MSASTDPQNGDGERRRARVDLTINIPTMVSLAVLVITTSAWGVGIYYNLDKRQMMTDVAVTALSQRVDRLETSINGVKVDQTTASTTLRNDMKAEMNEIKTMLNRILFSSPTVTQRQLKEWSKE